MKSGGLAQPGTSQLLTAQSKWAGAGTAMQESPLATPPPQSPAGCPGRQLIPRSGMQLQLWELCRGREGCGSRSLDRQPPGRLLTTGVSPPNTTDIWVQIILRLRADLHFAGGQQHSCSPPAGCHGSSPTEQRWVSPPAGVPRGLGSGLRGCPDWPTRWLSSQLCGTAALEQERLLCGPGMF